MNIAYFLPEVDPEEVKADVPPPNPVCPDIKASEGASANKALLGIKYNGIMGSICKHHSVYKMLNISSRGEKYIFARTILESICNELWTKTIIFKYDIWCNFLPYLRNRNFVGIPRISCIPIGHALTHIMKCQYQYFPWLVEGNGLSPGEEIETLWSKLRHLWARIREMGLGTREDAISDQIEQINRMVLEELPEMLLKQLDRVERARLMALQDLKELRETFPQVDLSDLALNSLDLSKFGSVIAVDWKIRYVRFMLEYKHQQSQADSFDPDTPEFNASHISIRALNKVLLDTEKDKKIARFTEDRMLLYRDAALVLWKRDLKDKLRTTMVLDKYYADKQKTYRKTVK